MKVDLTVNGKEVSADVEDRMLLVHFLRDVATAPIALWWPVSSAGILVPGYWYLAALLVLATLPPPHRRP